MMHVCYATHSHREPWRLEPNAQVISHHWKDLYIIPSMFDTSHWQSGFLHDCSKPSKVHKFPTIASYIICLYNLEITTILPHKTIIKIVV